MKRRRASYPWATASTCAFERATRDIAADVAANVATDAGTLSLRALRMSKDGPHAGRLY
jgi:hypothetical protein